MPAAGLTIASLVMMLGALIQGSIGFGTNLVAAPILAIIDPKLVPVPVILASSVFNVLLGRRERGDHPWARMRLPIIGLVPASILGAAAVALVSPRGLGILFGVLVLIGVGISVSGRHPWPTPRRELIAGFASGFMGTTTGIGGPPMALLYQRERGPLLRAAFARFFGIGSLISILALVAFGKVHLSDVGRALVLLPGGFLGFLLSKRLAGVLDHGYVRHAVLAVSGTSAVVVLVRALV